MSTEYGFIVELKLPGRLAGQTSNLVHGMGKRLKIAYRTVCELIAAEYNPRSLSPEQFEDIKASLLRFDCVDPIIVNMHPDRQNIIIGGHQRVKVAKAIGLLTLPCVELSLDREHERELNIRLNKNTGGWDFDLLQQHFTPTELMEWGFTEEEMDFTIEDPTIDGLTDPDEVPDPPEEPITRPGDIIVLGNHRLMCGDSASGKVIGLLMDGKQADVLFTDPPYNVAYQGKTEDLMTIENDDMDPESYREFLDSCLSNASFCLVPGGAFYIWHADMFGGLVRSSCDEIGLQVRQCLIWKKNSLVLGRQDYQWIHEPCLYGWKLGAAHKWYGDRKQTTIIECDRPSRSAEHPTMKPVELIVPLLKNSSKPGDIILDTFGGSGSTLIACEMTGRHAYLNELDPHYCDVIVKRWEDFTGNTAVRLGGSDACR